MLVVGFILVSGVFCMFWCFRLVIVGVCDLISDFKSCSVYIMDLLYCFLMLSWFIFIYVISFIINLKKKNYK